MLTNLDFLTPGAQWPPKGETDRLKRYRDNKQLFEGKHEAVFQEVWARLFRPDLRMSVEMCLNWPKRLSTLWADLLLGETPTLTDAAGGAGTAYLGDLATRLVLWNTAYRAAIDASRYGDAVLKARRRADGKVRLSVIPPGCWFPVVSPEDAAEITHHVLAWPVGDVEARTMRLMVEIHSAGIVEFRTYAMPNWPVTLHQPGSVCSLGRILETRVEQTGVDAPLVVHVANLATSDRIYGLDDYDDLTSIVQELEVRFAQVARVLDRHADPKMFGPDVTRRDPETGVLVADIGDYIPREPGEEPPGYIVWDAQTEASFRQVEMLMEQFYMLSETSPAAFGNLKAGLAESGSALRRLMMAPLAKVNRVRMGFDAGLREVLRLAALLDSGRAVEPVIGWADGLPDDESEEIRNEATAVASEVTSRRSSMKRLWGYTDEQADEELRRIRAEQPTAPEPVLGEGGPDEEEA